MEKQYSVQFFTSFVESLQDLCRTHLTYSEFVEVSGYVCLEIDNIKKERYVLSELLQSSGNVVSESYCTKAFKMSRSGIRSGGLARDAQNSRPQQPTPNRNIDKMNLQRGREKMAPQKSNVNRRRSWNESPTDHQNVPPKVRRSNEVIEIIDETDRRPVQRSDRERMKPPPQMYPAPAPAAPPPGQRQRYPAPSGMPPLQHAPRTQPAPNMPPAGQRRPQEFYDNMNMQRSGALRHPGSGNASQRVFNPAKRPNQDPNLLSSAPGKSAYHSNPNPNSIVQQFPVQHVQSPVSRVTSTVQQFPVQSPVSHATSSTMQQFPVHSPVSHVSSSTVQQFPVQHVPASHTTSSAVQQFNVQHVQSPVSHATSTVQQFNVQHVQSPVSHATSTVQQFPVQHVQNPNPSLSSNLGPALGASPSPSSNLQPGIHQFNVQKPPPPNQTANFQPVNIKLEFASGDQSQVDYSKQEAAEAVSKSVKAQPQPVRRSSQPESSHGQNAQIAEDTAKTIKQEPVLLSLTLPPGVDEDEIIDLDLFDDELVDTPADTPDDQTALAKEYAVAGSQAPKNETAFAPTTQKVVTYSVKQFKKFHMIKSGLDVNPFTIAPQQFDQLLLDFYKGLRKVSGEELTGRTLKNVQIHLNMYYRDQQYPHSIVKDDLFKVSRDYVKSKLDAYMTTQKHVPVNNDDVEVLFNCGALGCQNPESLINTMWFMNSMFFCTKRPVDHFNMKWGSIGLKKDDTDQEYLEFIVNNMHSLKVFAKPDNPSRCFVNFYKQFQCLRPKDSLYPDSPFYLKFQKNIPALGVWYVNEPATLSQFQYTWRKLVTTARLPSNKRIV